MATVTVTEAVAAPPDHVWEVLCDMESFPRWMQSVQQLQVLRRGPTWTETAWVAKIQGGTFRWVERDDFFADQYRIRYQQLSGDLKVFQGEWRLEPQAPSGTVVTLVTEFEFGLPMLAPILVPVAKKALRENARAMLQAIGHAAGEN